MLSVIEFKLTYVSASEFMFPFLTDFQQLLPAAPLNYKPFRVEQRAFTDDTTEKKSLEDVSFVAF